MLKKRNHPEVLQLLLGNGASPTDIKYNLRTPLQHLAAMKGHIEVFGCYWKTSDGI
jgi:hypothetical protein